MASKRQRAFTKATLGRAVATSALTTLAMLGAGSAQAQDLPTGGTVTSGSATISGNGGAVTVDQTSAKAIVNWASFDVAASKSVIFRQPDAQSATLNRVTGGTTSTIAGQIVANGAVYLINPNGIAITATGSVQTGGGFVASTLDIADSDFNAGKLAFTGSGTAARVDNAGSITAGAGGYVALLGGQVSNSGLISVPLGKVALGAGESMTLDLNGDGFLQVAVPGALVTNGAATGDRATMKVGAVRDAVRGVVNVPGSLSADSAVGSDGSIVLGGTLGGTLGGMPRADSAQVAAASFAAAPASDASVSNSGFIGASGGLVALTSAGALTHSGKIDTNNLNGDGGRVFLLGDSVVASGKIRAAALGATGNGGFVETSGNSIDFTGVKVDTSAAHGTGGTWLVDPDDLVIDAAAAATISSNLATTGVTLETTSTTASTTPGGLVPGTPGGNGDITINSAISWTSANTLTLLSYNNIALNAAITGTNGGLTLTAGNNVAVTGNITASAAVNVGTFNLTNGNWSQIAASLPTFSATDFRTSYANATFLRVLGGNGSSSAYQIADVYGLQGMASGALLANSFVLANDINASGTSGWNGGAAFNPIGRLAGSGPGAFTGSLDGQGHVIGGLTINNSVPIYIGLFGLISNATISNVGLSGVSITSTDSGAVGGLVGSASSGSTITNSYVTGSVTLSSNAGSGNLGGLVGVLGGSVSNSYSTATVTGFRNTGGLVGQAAFGSSISGSYATGAVSGTTQIGGLVGQLTGTIANSYARGSATASGVAAGGLVGILSTNGVISNSYAIGSASAASNAGGLAGTANGNASITRSYATGTATTTSGNAAGGLVGLMSNTSTASEVYATGNVVSFNNNAGGLVGQNSSTGAITDAYATGSVRGVSNVGGLAGTKSAGTMTSVYATGAVSGTSNNIGGLVGAGGGTITNGYWDIYSTGQGNAFGSGTPDVSITAVTSDPAQSGAANYAYRASAYANLNGGLGVGTATPTGFVFVAGNSTRPFLAFEVPTAAVLATDGLGRVQLTNSHQLQLIGYNAATNAASYALTGNIDLRETGQVSAGLPASYAGMWATTGFVPLGTDGAGNVWNGSSYVLLSTIAAGAAHGFSGAFDGGGYTLSNLTIARGAVKNVGLFGVSSGGIANVTVGGTVTGLNSVGGLAGLLYTGGSVTLANSTVAVTGNNLVGGLVGNATDGSSISRSSASGTISGVGDVGGLIGYASGAAISRSFATGGVSGATYVGGLIGYQYNGTTSNSYATGTVAASTLGAGGLVGTLYGGSVVNSYAANQVTAPRYLGGLIGQAIGTTTVTSSYWDTTLSGLATSAGGTGRTTAQMQDPVNYAANYPGWDFSTVWLPPTTGTYPKLR